MKRLIALMLLVLLAVCLPSAAAASESTANNTAVVLPDDVPSPWAYDGVRQAIVLGMTPSGLQTHWRHPVTRIEFAEMVVHFLAFQYGYLDDGTFLSVYCANSTDRNGAAFGGGSWWNYFCGRIQPFADLYLPESRGYGNAAYALGLINGRSADSFAPNEPLTRQEAAAILMRCYRRYDRDYRSGDQSGVISDWDAVASWAAEDVASVLDMKVMNGTAEGLFDPEGICTREQAVLSLLRLYANAPVSRGSRNMPKL